MIKFVFTLYFKLLLIIKKSSFIYISFNLLEDQILNSDILPARYPSKAP